MTKGSRFELFYSDLFSTPNITDSRLQVFCRFVIAAITAANINGIFNDILSQLTEAFSNYFGELKEKNIIEAKRKGSTQSLNDQIKNFADTVRSKYNSIAGVFPKGSPVYIEFFPHGLSEMSMLTRGNILEIVHRFAIVAFEYKTQLGGAPFAALFSTIETNITAALNVQTDKKVAGKSVNSDLHTMRAPLENALMAVMYKIGSTYLPDYVKCSSFFDFSLLYANHHTSGNDYTGTLTPMQTSLCIQAALSETNIFTLINLGKVPIRFYITATKGGPVIGHIIEVNQNSEQVIPFAEFGAANGQFLYVQNFTDYPVSWEVKLDG